MSFFKFLAAAYW